MSDKKKITVKINGENSPFQEINEKDKQNEHSLDEIYEQLENVIDFTKKKQERKRNREPFWDDGNHHHIPKLPFQKRKKKRLFSGLSKLPLTILVASISAIIIGLGLGMMLLAIFTGGSDEPVVATISPASEELELQKVAATAGEELSVLLIQVGAFSDLQKGREMASLIEDKGFSAVINEASEPVLVFAGIALERGQAELIKEKIEAAGFEAFIKTEQLSIPADDASKDIFQQLLTLTERSLNNEVKADEVAAIQLKLNEGTIGNAEMEKGLHDVVASLQNYLISQDEQLLWRAQTKLMEVMMELKK